MAHTHSTQWNYLYGTLSDFVDNGSVMLSTLKVDTSVGFIFTMFCLVEKQCSVVIVSSIVYFTIEAPSIGLI